MMHNQKSSVFPAVVLMGFTAIVVQVILMRELVVIFYGNELSLGAMLGVWLLWTAAGSGILGRFFQRIRHIQRSIGAIQLLLAFLLLFLIFLVRSGKILFDYTMGEMLGFTPMLLVSLITLAPFCLISGLLFTLFCRHMHAQENEAGTAAGRVYLIESIGAGLGGVTASFILFRLIGTELTFLALSVLNIVSGLSVGRFNPFRKKRDRIVWVLGLALVYALIGIAITGRIGECSESILWKGFERVRIRNTVYGNIAVTRMGSQMSFFENGLLMFSSPDPLTEEESVHFALLEHPAPGRVLLIGGNPAGIVRETLRHPGVTALDYVELDPEMIRLAEHYLPAEETAVFSDPRVRIHHLDGRRFLKRTQNRYDIILLNLPNPHTAQINRFYTIEFFRDVLLKMNPGGVFCLQVSSSENAIGPELSDFLSTIYATLRSVFQDIVILPGETARFLASAQTGILTSDSRVLIDRLKERNLNTLYVREYYLPFQLSRERLSYLWSQIHRVEENKLNRDFKPIGYLYDTLLWATTYSATFKTVFDFFTRLKMIHFIGLLILFTAGVLVNASIRRGECRSRPGLFYSILSIGFTEISLEVILLLSFQILFGYVYQFLAIIVAGYMIGLALGSGLAISKRTRTRRTFSYFRRFQLIMTFLPVVIAGCLYLLHRYSLFASQSDGLGWCFPLFTAGAGFIGGYQFPLANQLTLSSHSLGRNAGMLYAVDLVGSALGALLTSAFLLPTLGIFRTLALLSLLNAMCLLTLYVPGRSRTPHPAV